MSRGVSVRFGVESSRHLGFHLAAQSLHVLNGEVIGMVNLLFTISTAEGGRVILLEDLIVRREHRGRGLGTTLMKATIALAKDEGISRITLLTDLDNTEAICFYQKHGFQTSLMKPLRLRVET